MRISAFSMQVLREFSQDWSRRDMGDAVIDMMTHHAGADGTGVEDAECTRPWLTNPM
jgi:hypothetical protein